MKKNHGFTMLELLLVLVVVVVLSVTLPAFINSIVKPYIEKEQVTEFVEDIRLEAELHGTKLMSSCKLFEVANSEGKPTEFIINDGGDNALDTSNVIDHASYSFKAVNGEFFTKEEMQADHSKRTKLNKVQIKIFMSKPYKEKAAYFANSLQGQLLSSGDGVLFEYPLSSAYIRNSETPLSPCLYDPVDQDNEANYE
ncbi:prepilin-type N-terminal cleavage/methylation domain-containing protein [Photobacterium leiognathi]|uniref:prepilin-type N-terminal cleavage/methylation domain-containing protein n=1 Tax=Photobacterium leiognathi TaxID=553611 RepID=UPI002980A878|nr:prepilin-type N-terminal cleavage/methylation domain-containing protein [Photobacterium leiognathi]